MKLRFFKFIKLNFRFHIKLNINRLDFIILRTRKNLKHKEIYNFKKSISKKRTKKKRKRLGLKAINFKKINLQLVVGLDDAYNTAMLCGFINCIFDSTSQVLSGKKNFSQISYSLKPCYNSPIYKMSNCNRASVNMKFEKSFFYRSKLGLLNQICNL